MPRNRVVLVCVAFLASAVSAAPSQPAKKDSRFKLIGNTGDVSFTDDKGLVRMLASVKRIPVGSTLRVEHGIGIVQIAGAVIRFGESDSFSLIALAQNKGALAVEGVTGGPLVTQKNNTQKLAPGQVIVLIGEDDVLPGEEPPPEPIFPPRPNPAQELNATEPQPISPSAPH